ncbi:MAG: hypothetical protein ACPG8W_03215 [Candidatus Promineifilaceae bacterium]
MMTVTHFRSEFIQQQQATIVRKVTMTQFLFVVTFTAISVGLLGAPFWLAPFFMLLGYAAGYTYQGEIVIKRLVAYTIVWLRSFFGRPRIINVQAEWDAVRQQAERQQIHGLFAASVIVEPLSKKGG